jgi:hypothetical protein
MEAMSIRNHFATRQAASLPKVAVCVVTVLMLLAFPLRSTHHFADHFRNPEVRRSIERHTPIAHSDTETTGRVAHQIVLPAFVSPLDIGKARFPVTKVQVSSETPISRFLLRLKLGSSRSGSQDLLI